MFPGETRLGPLTNNRRRHHNRQSQLKSQPVAKTNGENRRGERQLKQFDREEA